jgi:hypothetical protein
MLKKSYALEILTVKSLEFCKVEINNFKVVEPLCNEYFFVQKISGKKCMTFSRAEFLNLSYFHIHLWQKFSITSTVCF